MALTPVFPFAVVKLPVEHFHALHNEVQSGHHFVDHVGESERGCLFVPIQQAIDVDRGGRDGAYPVIRTPDTGMSRVQVVSHDRLLYLK